MSKASWLALHQHLYQQVSPQYVSETVLKREKGRLVCKVRSKPLPMLAALLCAHTCCLPGDALDVSCSPVWGEPLGSRSYAARFVAWKPLSLVELKHSCSICNNQGFSSVLIFYFYMLLVFIPACTLSCSVCIGVEELFKSSVDQQLTYWVLEHQWLIPSPISGKKLELNTSYLSHSSTPTDLEGWRVDLNAIHFTVEIKGFLVASWEGRCFIWLTTLSKYYR